MSRQIKGITCTNCGTLNEGGKANCFSCGRLLVKQVNTGKSSKSEGGGLVPLLSVIGAGILIFIAAQWSLAEQRQRDNRFATVDARQTADAQQSIQIPDPAIETITVALSLERQQITAGQNGKLQLILNASDPHALTKITEIKIALTYSIKTNAYEERRMGVYSGNIIAQLPSTTEHTMRPVDTSKTSIEVMQVLIDCKRVCFTTPPHLPLTLYEIKFETNEDSSGIIPVRYLNDPNESNILTPSKMNVLDLKNSTDATIELQ